MIDGIRSREINNVQKKYQTRSRARTLTEREC